MSARNEVTLEFEDGSKETVKIKPRYAIEAEEKYGRGPGGTPPLKGTIYAAWLALGKPGSGFNSFVKSLEAITLPGDDYEDDDE